MLAYSVIVVIIVATSIPLVISYYSIFKNAVMGDVTV